VSEDLEAVKSFVSKVLAEPEKYTDMLEKGLYGIEKARSLLEKLKDGDTDGADLILTEWDDVNLNIRAIHAMDKALEDARNGVDLDDVLAGAAQVLKYGLMIGAALA